MVAGQAMVAAGVQSRPVTPSTVGVSGVAAAQQGAGFARTGYSQFAQAGGAPGASGRGPTSLTVDIINAQTINTATLNAQTLNVPAFLSGTVAAPGSAQYPQPSFQAQQGLHPYPQGTSQAASSAAHGPDTGAGATGGAGAGQGLGMAMAASSSVPGPGTAPANPSSAATAQSFYGGAQVPQRLAGAGKVIVARGPATGVGR